MSRSVTEYLTGYFPWTPKHPCFDGHKLVDSDTPMVCDRCGAWLVYNPKGSWRPAAADDGLRADGGVEQTNNERWNDLRETWVDLKNGRETRSSELVEAWQDSGLDLVTNSDPIPLPDDARVCPDAAMFASVISPDWLAGPDGTTSYMDLVFRSSEYELRRQQRDRAIEEHASAKQHTLKAMTDGGIAVGSYDDLAPRGDQPVDRNPSLSCKICGESYKWQDYWKDRILSQDADPDEVPLWCDECEEEIEELRRRRSENADLDEWQKHD